MALDRELYRELEDIKVLIAKYLETNVLSNVKKTCETIKNTIIEPVYNINENIANKISILIYNSFGKLFSQILTDVLAQINEKYTNTLVKKQNIINNQNKTIELFKAKVFKLQILNEELIYTNNKYSNELSVFKEKELYKDNIKYINKNIQTDTTKIIDSIKYTNSIIQTDDLKINSFKKSIYRLWDSKPRMYLNVHLCHECAKLQMKGLEYLNLETLN